MKLNLSFEIQLDQLLPSKRYFVRFKLNQDDEILTPYFDNLAALQHHMIKRYGFSGRNFMELLNEFNQRERIE